MAEPRDTGKLDNLLIHVAATDKGVSQESFALIKEMVGIIREQHAELTALREEVSTQRAAIYTLDRELGSHRIHSHNARDGAYAFHEVGDYGTEELPL